MNPDWRVDWLLEKFLEDRRLKSFFAKLKKEKLDFEIIQLCGQTETGTRFSFEINPKIAEVEAWVDISKKIEWFDFQSNTKTNVTISQEVKINLPLDGRKKITLDYQLIKIHRIH